MRKSFPLILSLLAAPALAQTDISTEIGQSGLNATEARLAALSIPTDADLFALAGVRFLRGIEGVLQTRWRSGMTDNLRLLPLFRLPIDENPAPPPFDPATITNAFREVATQMDSARTPLTQIPDTSDFGLTIRFTDLWFDVNANATRDPGEDMLDVAGPILLGWQWDERDPATPAPVIRFDAADAAWLSAYTHLLGGISEIILAYDPTKAIAQVAQTRATLGLQNRQSTDFDFNSSFGDFADVFFVLDCALNQAPDAQRLAAAHQHFLAMIADNRSFWSRVALETDNDAEWLPNATQTSGLGLTLPPDTGPLWLSVLTDAEALLKGDLLAPYWRLDDAAGINIARIFTNPAPIDLIGWIQGTDALPYLQKGPLISDQNWGRFQDMMGGEAMLMTLFLN